MSLALSATSLAVVVGNQSSFQASGGTSPYQYAVVPGGVGGTINGSTGIYTAPAVVTIDPTSPNFYDTVQATDSANPPATATLQILVGTPLQLLLDIIETELGLAQGRAFLWDQKIFQPSDDGLYIPISILRCKPFGVTNKFNPSTNSTDQSVNMQAQCDINIISRDTSALFRKEEVILALSSDYSKQQQALNGFYVAILSDSFNDVSVVDGAAIPYRFVISVNIMYAFKKAVATQYFDSFQTPTVSTNA